MGVPTSEVGYTSVTAGRGDHEVNKGHVVALVKKKTFAIFYDSPNQVFYAFLSYSVHSLCLAHLTALDDETNHVMRITVSNVE
jgi:hypothetical protein